MKIAFYMEDGLEQIVLTPENEFEKSMLNKVHSSDRGLEIKKGGFYGCEGGWSRWNAYGGDDDSTILVLRPRRGSGDAIG